MADIDAEGKATRPWYERFGWPVFGIALVLLGLLAAYLWWSARQTESSDKALSGEDQALRELRKAEVDALKQEIERYNNALEGDVCSVPVEEGPVTRVDPLAPLPASGDDQRQPQGTDSEPTNEDKSSQAAKNSHKTLADLMEESTLFILGKESIGTGFVIQPGLILTNAHVVGDSDKVYVGNKSLSKLETAAVIARSNSKQGRVKDRDYALLKAPATSELTSFQFTENINKLLPVVAAGYPGVLMARDVNFNKLLKGDITALPELVLTSGEVSVVQDVASAKKVKSIVHTADISPGNSGGPLVDRCGRVLGINTYILTSTEDHAPISYALDVNGILDFLGSQGVQPALNNSECS